MNNCLTIRADTLYTHTHPTGTTVQSNIRLLTLLLRATTLLEQEGRKPPTPLNSSRRSHLATDILDLLYHYLPDTFYLVCKKSKVGTKSCLALWGVPLCVVFTIGSPLSTIDLSFHPRPFPSLQATQRPKKLQSEPYLDDTTQLDRRCIHMSN